MRARARPRVESEREKERKREREREREMCVRERDLEGSAGITVEDPTAGGYGRRCQKFCNDLQLGKRKKISYIY